MEPTNSPNLLSFSLPWQIVLALVLFVWNFSRVGAPVFLLDFATFEAPESWKVTPEQTIDLMRRQKCFSEESVQFMERMLNQSGVGPATAWPPGINRCFKDEPYDSSIEASREEAEVSELSTLVAFLSIVINCSFVDSDCYV
jgi:3-ketoacyl-CoA synthase